MVGRLLSYWEGNFLGAMLNFGRVLRNCTKNRWKVIPAFLLARKKCDLKNSKPHQKIQKGTSQSQLKSLQIVSLKMTNLCMVVFKQKWGPNLRTSVDYLDVPLEVRING